MSYGEEVRVEQEIMHELARGRVMRDAERGVWTMRDGTEIEVKDMSTSHILNSKRMLERKNMADFLTPWITRFEKELERRANEQG